MTVVELARLSAVVVLTGVIIGDLEMLFRRRQLGPDGFYNWDFLRSSRSWTVRGRAASIADALFSYPNVLALIAVQLVAAVLAVLAAMEALPVRDLVWLVAVLAVSMLLHLRNQYGLDGADQMQAVVLSGLVLFWVAPTRLAQDIALIFIAAQGMLSYFTAGLAKLISPVWRNGTAIRDIVSTRSYGSSAATRVMQQHRLLSPALCWATICFECLLPLLVLVSPTACLVFIGMAVVFHVSIAALMGLNVFVWSFVATHPSLYFLSTLV
jgi:uncharacterized protein (DUF697 family)